MKDDFSEEEMMKDSIEEDTTALVEDDEISPEEAGFMRGYEEAENSEPEETEEEM